jgi:hypothetical protein
LSLNKKQAETGEASKSQIQGSQKVREENLKKRRKPGGEWAGTNLSLY